MAAYAQRAHRKYLAQLIAARDVLAATLDDAALAQHDVTTLLLRWLFLRQLHAWALPFNDADLIAASLHRRIAALCQLPDDAPFSTLIGAIVEKQDDQKRKGAYYTSADVSGYIATQCIVPALLDTVSQRRPAQFAACWSLLQREPERYIAPALRHSCAALLPAEIARGIDDVAARTSWNTPAPPAYALPNESWREVIMRRQRYVDVHEIVSSGAVQTPNDLVTLNLDVQQFALDCIAVCDDGELLAAWRSALLELTVLDPTCGSGAFLLAALEVLRPLYAACWRRASPPVCDAEIIKTIIANNLYGIDISPAAAEACRLRLYLVYAAEAGIRFELQCPISFNIVVGNVLVVGEQSGDAEQEPASSRRHIIASSHPSRPFPSQFDAIIGNPPYLATSKAPYSVRGYATERCGNLYALVMERALALLRSGGRFGMIVPIASVATETMRPLQQLYADLWQWHSHYAVRPGKLFPDVDMNLTITLLHNSRYEARCYSTGYRRWSGVGTERDYLFSTLAYTEVASFEPHSRRLPKFGTLIEAQILSKMRAHGRTLHDYATSDGALLYYHSGGRYWRKAVFARQSSHYKPLCVSTIALPVIFCLLNSQLFYWYWISHSNCMDVVSREVLDLPVFNIEAGDEALFQPFVQPLLDSYTRNSSTRVRRGQRINGAELNVDVGEAKPIIDAIDRALAQRYGFTDTEVDFLLSFDIKYRLKQK